MVEMGKRVPRTRASNTMTEAGFWTFIRSNLRLATLKWKPKRDAKLAARREYKGPNKRQKWEFQCAMCEEWFLDRETQVDHIIPAGSCKSFADMEGFIERLFCEVDGFQVLCKNCHQEHKTNVQRNKKTP